MRDQQFAHTLVAHRDPVVRRSLLLNLAKVPGVIVIGEAQSGISVADQTVNLSPHLVLMDIALPAINGIDATRIIKRVSPTTRVLIVSESVNDAYLALSIAAGADGYWIKSPTAHDLELAVRSVLSGAFWIDGHVTRKFILEAVTRTNEETGVVLDLTHYPRHVVAPHPSPFPQPSTSKGASFNDSTHKPTHLSGPSDGGLNR